MVAGTGKQQKKPEKDVLIAEAPDPPRRPLSLSQPEIEEKGNKHNALCHPNARYAALPAPGTHRTPTK